jgi:hypothetical protein
LPVSFTSIVDNDEVETLQFWNEMSNFQMASVTKKNKQKNWDDKITDFQFMQLLQNATQPEDKARLLAAKEPQTGA